MSTRIFKNRHTLADAHAELDRLAKAGWRITSGLPQTMRDARGSYYLTLEEPEVEHEGRYYPAVTARFSNHRRPLQGLLNHGRMDFDTETYWVDGLVEFLSLL